MSLRVHGSEFCGGLGGWSLTVRLPLSMPRSAVRPAGRMGARIEADPLVVRWVGAEGRGWSGIAWSGLGDADGRRAVIAAQVAYFAARGEKFEWKLYDYDRPVTWVRACWRPASAPRARSR